MSPLRNNFAHFYNIILCLHNVLGIDCHYFSIGNTADSFKEKLSLCFPLPHDICLHDQANILFSHKRKLSIVRKNESLCISI